MSKISIKGETKSVQAFLKTGANNLFIIPDYQRSYAWTEEQVEALFNDLWEFTKSEGGTENEGNYFLGSVVFYKNTENQQEIIDGQQRITSLFLLLRAIHAKLNLIEEKPLEAKQSIADIEQTIWKCHKITKEADYSNSLITSKAIDSQGNQVLHDILKTGEVQLNAKDNYSLNYEKFQELLDKKSQNDPYRIHEFIYALLNQVILLVVSADSLNTALTIFSTLNDRGLPLTDADIFKAKIYNRLSGKEQEKFIEKWKELEKEANGTGESLQKLFYYHMFYLRAKNKETSTSIPGLRKYYLEKMDSKDNQLDFSELMTELNTLLNFWKVVYNRAILIEEKWSENFKILTALDILTSYPNEYWKYPVAIYYLEYKNKDNFENNFLIFLNKLNGELIAKYLVTPGINAIKSHILNLNVEIINTAHPQIDLKKDRDALEDIIATPHKDMMERMLLKVLAYANPKQEKLLPKDWHKEHIFSRKYDNTHFKNVEEIKEVIENLGNKLPFEAKLNTSASNGYFIYKKKKYIESNIAITKEMGTGTKEDWMPKDIRKRDVEVTNMIMGVLDSWDKAYIEAVNPTQEQPSAEQIAQIEEFKKKGWI